MAEGSSYEVGQGYVQLTASGKGLQKKVDKELSEVQAEKSVKLDLDAAKLRADAAKVKAELARLSAEKASPSVDLDIRAAEAKRADITAKLEALSGKTASPKVDAEVAAAQQKLAAVDRKLTELNAKRASVDVDADIAAAEQKLASIGRRAQQIESQRVQLQVDADAAGATGELAGVDRWVSRLDGRTAHVNVDASSGSQASLILFGVVGALGAVGAAAPVAAAGAALAAGAIGALGQAAGAAALGFSGIGDALKATEQAEKSAATTSSAAGSSRAASAKAVQSAVGALSQAQTQANRAAITGAQQVRDAELALGQARVQADQAAVEGAERVRAARTALADAQVSAAGRVADAERSLGTAQESVRFAQEALTRARRDAAEANEDLNLSLSGVAISERRALLAQKKAQEALAAGRAAGASGDQMTELVLNVDEATQNLAEVRERFGDLRAEQAEFARTGIEGTKGVTDAHRSLQAAQRGAQDAQRALTQAQVDGARQVADAQADLVSSQRDAAQSQAAANERVAEAATALARAQQQAGWAQADAARGVTDAQRALRDALAETGEAGAGASAGAAALGYALGKLTPEGRAFVDFLNKEWKPAWEQTSNAVASQLLPRVQTALGNILKLQPVFTAGLVESGRVLGDLAVKGSELASSPAFQASFATIMSSNNRMLQGMGTAGISLFGALTDLWTVAGPVAEEFIRLGEYGAEAFESWVIGARQSGELAAGMRTAGDALYFVGGVLGQVIGGVWDLTQGLAPLGGALLTGVGATAEFVGWLAQLNPTVTSLVAGAGLAAVAMSKLGTAMAGASFASATGGIAGFASTMRTVLTPSLLAATPMMTGLASGFATAGYRAGSAVGGVTKWSGAANAGYTAGSKLGNAVSRVGSALPLVGAAAIAAYAILDTFTVSAGEAAEALMKGGQSASAMRAELAANDAAFTGATNGFDAFNDAVARTINGWLGVNATSADARAEVDRQRASMTNLERAQSFATEAQGNYEAAVRQFGAVSPEAQTALAGLRSRTNEVENAQRAARDGTDLATAAIANQRDTIQGTVDADLQKRMAIREMEKAQRALADAVSQYGANSPQAVDASLQLESAQSRVSSSALRAQDGLNGQARAIGDMVMATQGPLTPALNGLVQGMDRSAFAAAGARVEFDQAGRAVATFPNGKTVILDANASPVYPELAAVKLAVDSTRGTIGVDADPTPGRMQVGAFKLATDTTRGVVTVDGNISPADQQRLGIQAKTDGTTGTMWINGNPVPADGQLNGARFRVDHTTGVMTVDANPRPADDVNAGVHDRANNPESFDINANPRPAEDRMSQFFGWLDREIAELGNFLGFDATQRMLGRPGYAKGGLVTGYATGGAVSGSSLRGYATGAGGSNRIARSDTVPAMLTPGEFVVRKSAVQALGVSTLQKLNGFAKGGPVGFAAGGWAAPGTVYEDGSVRGGRRAMDSPDDSPSLPVDPATAEAAAAATALLTQALALQASTVTSSVNPALTSQTQALTLVANTQQGTNVAALQALSLANQGLVASGLMPVVTQLLGTMFPTLAQYQFQTGTQSVLANQALQGSQFATQVSTSNTAANTAANSSYMTGSTTAMSVASQGQLANLRRGQDDTQASTYRMAANNAAQNNAIVSSTKWMSDNSQFHLAKLRDAQFVTMQATTNLRNWFGDRMAEMMGASANPMRWILQGPFNAGIIAAWNSLNAQFALGKVAAPVAIPFAQGGVHEDHRAQITRAGGPMRVWSEPETGGEAYIPMAASKRGRSTGILSTVAERFGYSLAPENYADGGVVQFADGGLWRRLAGVAQALIPGTRVNSTYRPGDPGYHGQGKAVDLGGNKPAINQALAQKFPNSTQLIYTPGTNLFRGRPHTYNAATRAEHYDHVHWAMESEAMLNGAPGSYAGGGAAFDPTPAINEAFAKTYQMLDSIPSVLGAGLPAVMGGGIARKGADAVKGKATAELMAKFAEAAMGATSNEAPGIVRIISDVARGRFGGLARQAAEIGTATGLVETNLRNLTRAVDHDSLGVFQQRPSMGWGTPAQLTNVTYAAGKFFSRFPGNWASQDPGTVAANVQRPAARYRGRYGQAMPKARALVGQYGGFDQGGEALGRGLMVKDIIQPERVLPPVETQSYNTLTELMGRTGGVRLTYDGGPDGGASSRTPVVIHQHLPDGASSRRFAQDVVHELRRNDFRGVH